MTTSPRMPVLYVGHGGGPGPWLDGYRLGPLDHTNMRAALQGLPGEVGSPRRQSSS